MKLLKRLFKPGRQSYAELKAANKETITREEKERIAHPKGLPTYVNIETTRECNLRCRMCPFHRSAESRKRWNAVNSYMPEEMFMAIAEELFPTLETAGMTVTGEFTLTPYLDKIFDTFEKYEVKLDAFTNAASLTKNQIRRMVELATCLSVSHDSCTPDKYTSIRRGASFDEVVKNMDLIVSERAKITGNKGPRLDLQVVLMKSNIDELSRIVGFAKEHGFDLVKAVHLVIFDRDLKDESLLYHRQLYNKCLKEALEEAKCVGIEAIFPPAFPENDGSISFAQLKPPEKGCQFLWQRSFINFDGEVMPCCAVNPPKVGNIKDNDGGFGAVWRGERYGALRESVYSDNPQHPSCTRCWMREPSIRPGTEEEYILFEGGE